MLVTENEHTLFSDDFLWDKDKKKKVSDNSALLGEVTEHLLKQACEQFADELFKYLDALWSVGLKVNPPKFQKSFGSLSGQHFS